METTARRRLVPLASKPASIPPVAVLRAMLRLARRHALADAEAILLRSGGTLPALRNTLRGLEQAGFVERLDQDAARLTLRGFAVAVAAGARRRALGASSAARRTASVRRVPRARAA